MWNFGTATVQVKAKIDPRFQSDIARETGAAAQTAGNKAGDMFGAAFSKNALKAGSLLTAGLAAGLSQLDNSARQYQATVGASAAETERAKAAAMALFKVNTAGFDDILGLMAKLRTDQGLTEEQTNRLAQSYLTWSKVAGGTATDAAKGFDDVLDVWNLTAEDGIGIMDKLVASNQKYGGSLQQRVADLHALGPALQALNLTIDDAIGLENLFEKAGLDAGSSQRALNTAVKNLKPGQSFDDLIAQISAIEDPTLRAQKAIEIFGARAGTQLATAFQPGITSLKDFGISAEEAAGKTTKAGADIDSSVPHQFELFIHNIGGQLLDLASPAGPVLLASASILQLAGSLGGPLLDALKGAATGLYGYATAATAAGAASVSAAASAGGLSGAVVTFGATVAAIGIPIAGLALGLKTIYDAAKQGDTAITDESRAIAEFDHQVGILDAALKSGSITQAQYDTALKKLRADHGDAAKASDNHKEAIDHARGAMVVATGAGKNLAAVTAAMTGRTLEQTGATKTNTTATNTNTTAQSELFQGLGDTTEAAWQLGIRFADEAAANDAARLAAVAALGPLSAEAAALDHVAFSAAVAARNLAAMGSAAVAADNANRARQIGRAHV